MPDKFKRGDAVKVLLSAKHTLDGELVEHDAKFVRLHPDGGWADVDLDRHHSIDDRSGQKIHRLSVPLSQLVAALLMLFFFALPAKGQHLGDVQLSTANQTFATVAAPITCTGSAQSFVVDNVGQSGHLATAQSNAASFVMEIDGSDGTSVPYKISGTPVSFANSGSTSYLVAANGYFPAFKLVVTCTAASTFALSYSGYATPVSLSVGPAGGATVNINSGVTNQVQGIIPQGTNGGPVFPVLEGALQSPINASFTTVGIDNFSGGVGGQCTIPSACSSTTVSAPPPAKSGEFAVGFESTVGSSGIGAPGCPASTGCVLAPWTPVAGTACAGGSPQGCAATLANVSSGQALVQSIGQANVTGFNVGAIVLTTATAVRQGATASGAAVSYSGNTLAGSTLIAALGCATTSTCSVSSVADTQGLVWKQILFQAGNAGSAQSGIAVWAATTVSAAAADTITFTLVSGSAQSATAVELTGATAAALTSPAITMQSDPTGAQVERVDAQFPNQFVCNVTISTATTTLCQAAPTTINGVAVRAYVTDVQVNTTTTGTASSVQLKTGTGTNCGTGTANLSAITYSTVTAAAPSLATFLGMRTPLIAPLQTEICVTQTGTPGTATVEVHGFFAP